MATTTSPYQYSTNTTSDPAFSGSTPEPQVLLSTVELWIQSAFFYFFLSGIVSNTACWLVCFAILRTKELRTRFYIIVGFLMLSRGLSCLTGLSSGLYRVFRTAGLTGTEQKRIVCIGIHFNLYFSWTIEMSILCTLVIDRMLAIIALGYYRKLTHRSAVYLCLAQFIGIGLIKTVPVLMLDPLMETASCVNMYGPINPTFSQFSQYIDFAIAIVIIILYIALILYVRLRVKAQTSTESNVLSVTLERQLRLIPVLRNLVLIHFGLMFPGKLLNSLGSLVPAQHQQRMVAYGGMILNVDVFVNAILLLVTNPEIRHAALPCLKGHGTEVQAITGTVSQDLRKGRLSKVTTTTKT